MCIYIYTCTNTYGKLNKGQRNPGGRFNAFLNRQHKPGIQNLEGKRQATSSTAGGCIHLQPPAPSSHQRGKRGVPCFIFNHLKIWAIVDDDPIHPVEKRSTSSIDNALFKTLWCIVSYVWNDTTQWRTSYWQKQMPIWKLWYVFKSEPSFYCLKNRKTVNSIKERVSWVLSI